MVIAIDEVATHSFLTSLFEEAVLEYELHFAIWELPGKSTKFFGGRDAIDAAVDLCARLALKKHQVYVGMGMFKNPPTSGRGDASSVDAIAALWADVDVASDLAHKGRKYAPDFRTAIEIATVGPFAPSLVVNSGYGAHCYWLLKEPWVFDTPEEREQAADFVARFIYTIKQKAAASKYEIDSTFDLARVLRPAGTINWKDLENPRIVAIDPCGTNARHVTDDFDPYISSVEYARGAASLGSVQHFVLRPNAKLGDNFFEALMANNAEFKRTWSAQREEFSGDNSRYDMALANILLRHGCDDQTVVDAMVQWRRQVACDPKLRVDYYQLTLGKVRASIDQERAIKRFSSEEIAPVEPASSSNGTGSAEMVKKFIGDLLGVKVSNLIQIDHDESVYFLELIDGVRVRIGRYEDLESPKKFAARIADKFGIVIPPEIRSPKSWAKLISFLFSIRKIENTTRPEHENKFGSLVQAYLSKVEIRDNIKLAVDGKDPFRKDGMVWINESKFVEACRVYFGIKIHDDAFRTGIAACKAKKERPRGDSGKQVVYWGIPEEFVDQEIGFDAESDSEPCT